MRNAAPFVCSTIIPVYNKWELTANCLNSLKKCNIPEGMQVIVIDNGSEDETAKSLAPLGATLFGDNFSLVRLDKNYGFSHACNVGAAQASSSLLFFLNNDTLLTENCLEPLINALNNDSCVGAVGPLLLYPNNDGIQHMGISYSPAGLSHIYRFFPDDHPVAMNYRPLQAITAAALMVRAQIFVRCGGFFEGYFNGFEDVELSCKIRQMGYRLLMVPSSRIYHLEGKSMGRHDKDIDNGRILFERCSSMLYYDMHLHAQLDGYSMRLTQAMEPFICMSQAQENAINQQTQNKTPTEWLTTLNQEPLWQTGYDKLTNFLISGKKIEEAMALAVRKFGFFPHFSNCMQALKLSKMAGDLDMAEDLEKHANEIAEKQSNPANQFKQAQEIISGKDSCADEQLQKIYLEWIEKYTTAQ